MRVVLSSVRFILFYCIVCTYFVPEMGARQSTSLMIFLHVYIKNGIIIISFNSDNEYCLSLFVNLSISDENFHE